MIDYPSWSSRCAGSRSCTERSTLGERKKRGPGSILPGFDVLRRQSKDLDVGKVESAGSSQRLRIAGGSSSCTGNKILAGVSTAEFGHGFRIDGRIAGVHRASALPTGARRSPQEAEAKASFWISRRRIWAHTHHSAEARSICAAFHAGNIVSSCQRTPRLMVNTGLRKLVLSGWLQAHNRSSYNDPRTSLLRGAVQNSWRSTRAGRSARRAGVQPRLRRTAGTGAMRSTQQPSPMKTPRAVRRRHG